jgi:hypothetical protein
MGTVFSVAVIVVMGLAVAGAFALVVVNRDSPQVIHAAVPVAFGALSALALVFAFGRPAPIEGTFPVIFVLQQADRYPVVIPHRPFPSMTLALFDDAVQANPTLLKDPRFSGFGGGPLFHQFLQRAIVDWLTSTYFGTWRARVERFRMVASGCAHQSRCFANLPRRTDFLRRINTFPSWRTSPLHFARSSRRHTSPAGALPTKFFHWNGVRLTSGQVRFAFTHRRTLKAASFRLRQNSARS